MVVFLSVWLQSHFHAGVHVSPQTNNGNLDFLIVTTIFQFIYSFIHWGRF